MFKCRIEVLKTEFYPDLVKEFGGENVGKCPRHKVGDVFYCGANKPEGLCDGAWTGMQQYVFALAHGGDNFFYGDWIVKKDVAICSCNDGMRPVIFKIQRTDEVLKRPKPV